MTELRPAAPRLVRRPDGAPPFSGTGLLRASRLERLKAAVLCADRDSAEAILGTLMGEGLSPQDLIDQYIPEAARCLGEDWASDSRSFVEVTIGSARLQAWIRELDPLAAPADRDFDLDAPELLVVVPRGSQHTLGAMVAMSQFRRLGALVRLSLGQDLGDLGRLVRTHRYAMVAISAAGSERLEFLKEVANMIRTGVAPVPKVVIGGAILAMEENEQTIAERIGADFATSDPKEALVLCGLNVSCSGGQARPRTRPPAPAHPS